MHPDRKAQLKERQQQANQKIRVKDFLATAVDPALELMYLLPDTALQPNELLYIRPEWREILKSTLSGPPYSGFRFADVLLLPDNGRLSGVFEVFGDILQLRYVPDIPVFLNSFDEKDHAIERMSAHLACEDEHVFLHHLRYAVIWKIRLSDLIKMDHEILFNSYNGDAVIFAESNSWLMSYSVEDQWYAGRKKD